VRRGVRICAGVQTHGAHDGADAAVIVSSAWARLRGEDDDGGGLGISLHILQRVPVAFLIGGPRSDSLLVVYQPTFPQPRGHVHARTTAARCRAAAAATSRAGAPAAVTGRRPSRTCRVARRRRCARAGSIVP
jgi:hypothetical protein